MVSPPHIRLPTPIIELYECMDYEHHNPVRVSTSWLCTFFMYLLYIDKNI